MLSSTPAQWSTSFSNPFGVSGFLTNTLRLCLRFKVKGPRVYDIRKRAARLKTEVPKHLCSQLGSRLSWTAPQYARRGPALKA